MMRIPLLFLAMTTFVVGFLQNCACGGPKKELRVVFEIRRAEEKPGNGLKELPVRGRDKKLFVREEADMTAKDISKAALEDFDDKVSISLFFTKQGEEKLRKLSRQHLSKSLAFMVDGAIVSAPVIHSELPLEPGGGVLIRGQFSREEAEKLVRSINHRRAD